jgi:hypothetical protein
MYCSWTQQKIVTLLSTIFGGTVDQESQEGVQGDARQLLSLGDNNRKRFITGAFSKQIHFGR